MGELVKLFSELGVNPPTLIICFLLWKSTSANKDLVKQLIESIQSQHERILKLEWEKEQKPS